MYKGNSNILGIFGKKSTLTLGIGKIFKKIIGFTNIIVQNILDNRNEFSHISFGQTITLTGATQVKINSLTWKGYRNTDAAVATMRCKVYDGVNGNLIATSDQTFDLNYQSITTCAFTFTDDTFNPITGNVFVTIEREAGSAVSASRVSDNSAYAGGNYYVNDGSWVLDNTDYDMYFDLNADII